METNVAEYLNAKFLELKLPGLACCLVYNNNFYTYCYGKSDLEADIPITEHSVFNIASVGKLITSVCIFSLIEKGLLNLHDNLAELLSEIPSHWESVKLSNLLSHSSGIPNYTDSAQYWSECQLDVTKHRIIEYVLGLELDFPPGSRWKYSNTGFYLLGMVVERITGKDFFEYASDFISSCKPGLEIFKTDDRINIPKRVTGYSMQSRKLTPSPYYSNSGTFAAGGFSASLRAFIEFENAVFNGEILSGDSLNAIIKPFTNEQGAMLFSPNRKYDFVMTHGLFRFNKAGRSYLAHGGDIMGFRTEYLRMVDVNFSAILSTNCDFKIEGLEILNNVYDLTTAKAKNLD